VSATGPSNAVLPFTAALQTNAALAGCYCRRPRVLLLLHWSIEHHRVGRQLRACQALCAGKLQVISTSRSPEGSGASAAMTRSTAVPLYANGDALMAVTVPARLTKMSEPLGPSSW